MVTILLENVLNSCLLWYTNKLQNIKEIVLGTCITVQQEIFQGVQFSRIGYVPTLWCGHSHLHVYPSCIVQSSVFHGFNPSMVSQLSTTVKTRPFDNFPLYDSLVPGFSPSHCLGTRLPILCIPISHKIYTRNNYIKLVDCNTVDLNQSGYNINY